jgi:hypothetical protein
MRTLMPTDKPTWKTVKTEIAYWDQKRLLGLVQDLYALNRTNADFLHARLLGSDEGDTLAPYKKRIQTAVCPKDPWKQDVRLSEGRKAIAEYRKAKGEPHGLLTLMIHYVSCGNDFTLEFGDIDEPFYSSMCSMVDQCCKLLIKEGDHDLAREFIPLLEAEFQRIDGQIGWGYPDEVGDQLLDLKDAFGMGD